VIQGPRGRICAPPVKRGFALRNWLVVFGLCVAAQNLAGQPALSDHEIELARTCLGARRCSRLRWKLTRRGGGVAGDTISADELKQAQQKLRPSSGAQEQSFTAAGGHFGRHRGIRGPFKTRAQLQAAFVDIFHSRPEDTAAPTPIPLYSSLGKIGGNLARIGAR